MDSSAVHPLCQPDDDDGPHDAPELLTPVSSPMSHAIHTVLPAVTRMSAYSGLTAAEPDVVPFGYSPPSRAWPLVSDFDDQGKEAVNPSGISRIRYPEISDDSDAELNGAARTAFEGVQAGGEEGEISMVGLVEGACASLQASTRMGVCDSAEELVLDEKVLDELRAASLEEDQLLHEVSSMLTPEQARMLGPGKIHSSVEDESSSGSAVNINDRGRDGSDTTQELPDSDEYWVEGEGATSSSNNLGQEAHDFAYNSPVTTSNSREMGTKRVYTFPRRETEVLAAAQEVGTQILSWPVGFAIEIIGFQVKFILQTVSFALWLWGFSFSVITFPIRATLKVTNAVLTIVMDGYTLATQVEPMIKKGVAQAGPVLKQTSRKCGFGCLAAVHVVFMLGSLLVPALFLDLVLVRWLMDAPMEFRQVLHFDYRQEHPSAVVTLLPPKVLAKLEGNVHPDKVQRVRAIPSSHKLQVTVFLTLPESPYNRQLGIFQVSAELLSVKGQILKRASWPCMLGYQSPPIRYTKQVILGVPLLLGLSRESQILGLRLFENEADTTPPTAMVRFILESKAGFPSGQGLPEVDSAEAQVLSVPPWAKDLLRRWKWTFFVWNGLSLFMCEIMLVLCCCHQVLLPSRLLQGITRDYAESDVPVKDTPVKRVGKPGRRVNFSDELPTARAIRQPSKAVDKVKERQLLLSSSAESTSILPGPTSRRVSSEANSAWSVPSLETLDCVGGKIEAVEESVRSLGETVIESASDGAGFALQ